MAKEVTSEQFEEIKELLAASVTLRTLMKKPGFLLQQKIILSRASRLCILEAGKIGGQK